MSDRIFLDTNVFVYALSKSVPSKQAIARRLVEQAIESGKGTISFQVVQEFFNVAFRRFTPPMTPAEADQFLSVTLRPLLAVHSSPSLYGEALQLFGKHSVSWYDALIVAAAIEGQCSVLYSEDFQHGQIFSGLRVVNPFL
jgi:predicted nucleic acid-binding protein